MPYDQQTASRTCILLHPWNPLNIQLAQPALGTTLQQSAAVCV